MSQEKTSKDSWDGLLTNFLKANHLTESEEKFACIGVIIDEKDMQLELEKAEIKYIFSLNVTNKVFLKENGINAPKEVIGKVLTLKKVIATNPQTRKEVDSLRISDIQEYIQQIH